MDADYSFDTIVTTSLFGSLFRKGCQLQGVVSLQPSMLGGTRCRHVRMEILPSLCFIYY